LLLVECRAGTGMGLKRECKRVSKGEGLIVELVKRGGRSGQRETVLVVEGRDGDRTLVPRGPRGGSKIS